MVDIESLVVTVVPAYIMGVSSPGLAFDDGLGPGTGGSLFGILRFFLQRSAEMLPV